MVTRRRSWSGATTTCACSDSTSTPWRCERARDRLARFGDRARLPRASFADLGAVAADHGISEARAVLLDLGVSSWQLEASGRGFSFLGDEPLDMRLDPTRAASRPRSC